MYLRVKDYIKLVCSKKYHKKFIKKFKKFFKYATFVIFNVL